MWLLGRHLRRLQAQQQHLYSLSHLTSLYILILRQGLSQNRALSSQFQLNKLSSSSQSSCLSAQSAGITDKRRCWEPQATFLATMAVCLSVVSRSLL